MDNNTTQDNNQPLIQEEPIVASLNTDNTDSQQEEKYKQILDEYSQQIKDTDTIPAVPVEDQSQPQVQSQPDEVVSTPSEPTPPTNPKPSLPHQLPPQDLGPAPTLEPTEPEPKLEVDQNPPQTPPKGKFNLFKYLFYLSTVVFIVILALLVKDYLKLQKLTQNAPSQPQPTGQVLPPTETPLPSSDQVCQVNDSQYNIGDTFPAEDGCNTCECQSTETGPKIICTLSDCLQEDVK